MKKIISLLLLVGSKQNTERIDVRTNNIDDFINDIQTS